MKMMSIISRKDLNTTMKTPDNRSLSLTMNISQYSVLLFLLLITRNNSLVSVVLVLYRVFFTILFFCSLIKTIDIIFTYKNNFIKTYSIANKAQSILYGIPTAIIIVVFSYIGVALRESEIKIAFFASLITLIITIDITSITGLNTYYLSTFVFNLTLFWFDLNILHNIKSYYSPDFDFEQWGGVQRFPLEVFITFFIYSIVTLLRFLYLIDYRKQKMC